MRRPPISADQNGDNVLSKQELIDALSKKSNRSNRNSNSRSRSPSASSGATDNAKPAFIAVSLELFEIQNDVDTTPFAEFVYNLPGIGDNLDQEIKKIKDCPGIQRVASCNCVTGINGGNFWDSSNRDFGFRNELQFRVVRVTPNVELELSWNFERKTGSKKQKVVVDRKTKSAKQIAITSQLEELIRQKIEEKKQELARKKANESAQGHKTPQNPEPRYPIGMRRSWCQRYFRQ